MPRFICIPVYDHATDEELLDITDDLAGMGFAHKPYIAEESHLPLAVTLEVTRQAAEELGVDLG